MEGMGKRVLIGVAWMGGARVIVNLFAFASTILLARLLTPEDFGLVAIVTAAAAVISAVSELSLTQALVKFDEPDDADYNSAWTLNFIRALVIAIAMVMISIPLAEAYSEPRLVPVFAVAAIGAAIGSLENPRIVVFRRQLDFRPDFQIAVGEKIASFAVAIALAFIFQSYWALVIGNVVASLVRVGMTYIKIAHKPRFDVSRWRELMSFSIWLTLAQVTKTVNLRGVPLIAGAFLPTAAVGHYSLGERVASMPIRETAGALVQALFPAFSRMDKDLPRIRRAYVRAQGMISLAVLPAGLGMAAVALPMVQVLLGEQWVPAVPIVQAVAVSSGILAVQNALPLAMATGRTQDIFRRNLRSLAIQIPLVVFGLYWGTGKGNLGLTGLAIALVVSAIINTLINMVLVRKLVGSPLIEQLGLAARPFIASVVMVGMVFALAEPVRGLGINPASVGGLLLLCGCGAGCYLGLLFILHTLIGGSRSAEGELFAMTKSLISRALARPR